VVDEPTLFKLGVDYALKFLSKIPSLLTLQAMATLQQKRCWLLKHRSGRRR